MILRKGCSRINRGRVEDNILTHNYNCCFIRYEWLSRGAAAEE